MSNIDKIRQEIERRKNEFYKKLPRACYPESCNSKEEERAIGIYGELTNLLSFLDSLPEEEPLEDLEEAAEEYADMHGFRVPYDGSNNFYDDIDVKASKDGFKAGVLWMAKQHANDVAEATESAFNAGKEQEPLRELIEQLKKLM